MCEKWYRFDLAGSPKLKTSYLVVATLPYLEAVTFTKKLTHADEKTAHAKGLLSGKVAHEPGVSRLCVKKAESNNSPWELHTHKSIHLCGLKAEVYGATIQYVANRLDEG